MKVLVFDNYDSFTYNLVHLLEKISGQTIDVCKNDGIELDEVEKYDKIVLSPGPGLPQDAGLLMALLQRFASSKSILGVCLGHQAIALHSGASLINLPEVTHGMATPIHIINQNDPLFQGLEKEILVGRYHSWVVSPVNLPDCLEVTALDAEGNIMALRHSDFDICSVQFHPESIMTPLGERMLANWVREGTGSM